MGLLYKSTVLGETRNICYTVLKKFSTFEHWDEWVEGHMILQQRPLRVLMVTARFFPFMGGIETHVYEVGRRLVQDGVEVTVLTTGLRTTSETLPREVDIEGMHVLRVHSWPEERDYHIAPEIYSLIQQGNWDLIHCQGCHTFVPPLAMLAARQACIPYVVTFHTGGHSSRLRTAIRDTQWYTQRSLLKGAAKLIGVSHFEANYFRALLRLSRKRFTVIPNGGMTLPHIPTSPSSSGSLIISPGRLERYKGHHRLIAALPAIQQQRPDTRLLILGTGPYENELRMLAQRLDVAEHVDIRLIPVSERKMMGQVLSQASVVALLSEYEAHPVAVMEALALRRPVLVADTSGMSELAQQGLVRAIPLDSSPEEIAYMVLQQIEKPLLPPANITLPTWDECAKRVRAVYDQCVRELVCVF